MAKAILTALLLLFVFATAIAQHKIYLGAKAVVTNDIYKIFDNGNGLKNLPLITGFWSFNLWQEVGKNFFIETGLLRKYYDEGIAFKIAPGYFESLAISTWMIPLRFGSKINLRKERIYLVPVLGFAYGINSDYSSYIYGNSGGDNSFLGTSRGDSIHFADRVYYNYRKTFPLLQAGVGLECKLFQTVLLSLSATYYAGLNKVIQQDITYKINNSTEQTATAQSKGNMVGLSLSLQYPISNFWTKTRK